MGIDFEKKVQWRNLSNSSYFYTTAKNLQPYIGMALLSSALLLSSLDTWSSCKKFSCGGQIVMKF